MRKENPTEQISISVPSNIRAALDELCYRRDLTRSQVATLAIKRFVVAEAHVWSPDLMDQFCHMFVEASNQKL
jgi:metal-responsive CopG/Arc/MetJ family transcriptional regulator